MIAPRLLIPLVVIAALAGCTAPAAPSAEPSSRPVTRQEPAPLTLEAGTVVANGRFSSVDGLTTGDVAISADGASGFTVDISRFASPLAGEVILNTSTKPFTEES
jgi:hypothetical protein